MNIQFQGKYKSIGPFEWNDIPSFVVITGLNGTGKSQLLRLIHATVVGSQQITEKLSISGAVFKPEEVSYIEGEWRLQNTGPFDYVRILNEVNRLYSNFRERQQWQRNDRGDLNLYAAYESVLTLSGKEDPQSISREEFVSLFPKYLLENEERIPHILSKVFFEYRLAEIDLKSRDYTPDGILAELGTKPWQVVREIIQESKLPFEINDPEGLALFDQFHLKLTHRQTHEEIDFSDLSSGEKVLLSLAFYLFSSREKNTFPKLLLLDEPDAHLHPSMSKQFLDVIKNILVEKYGVQVIMTTHSPSTVILAPDDSIYEMAFDKPRIRKSSSKSHLVSLLTSGLVLVNEGAKYLLVEDEADKVFYSYIFNEFLASGTVDSEVPLIFIPASTKTSTGGKNVVAGWVKKLRKSGLVGILNGLIDGDNGNPISDGIYKIDRYCIENYLADPIVAYAALLDLEIAPPIAEITLSLGQEHKLALMSNTQLQAIADTILAKLQSKMLSFFTDFDASLENTLREVEFVGDKKLSYPAWLLERTGKKLINEVYPAAFSPRVNREILFRALKRVNLLPVDLRDKFIEIRNSV
jgi:ABC-type Mn2+/Zn2+ transport system ATPase subunit